jgi:uncharacterized membrane protein
MVETSTTKEEISRVGRVFRHLGNRLFTGVLVAVPLLVTFLVLQVAYNFIDARGEWLWKQFGWEEIPGLGFVSTLLILLLLGYFATNVLGKKVIDTIEKVLTKIPLIAPVYNAVKQALESFKNMGSGKQFTRVAYVEYPSPGCYLIAFVTGHFKESTTGLEMTTCFVPTSPSPLTGFVVCIPTEQVIDCGLSLEQATKIIMSAGLVAPNQTPLPSVSGTVLAPASRQPG